MKVLVIGGGAREHALLARLAQDVAPVDLVCAPGNPGIAALAKTCPANVADPDELLAIAVRENVDFTIVGPELPLSVGVADRFDAARRLLLGPSAAAAR